MDGNRRWAQAEDTSTLAGHQRGAEVLQESIRWVQNAHIPHVVYYAFTTENWRRSEAEVSYLLELFRLQIDSLREKQQENVKKSEPPFRIRFIGRREDFDLDLREKMEQAEAQNKKYPDEVTTVWIALSYGGRAEIVSAVNKAVAQKTCVDEETFSSLLWSADIPDPDIIVRTSGVQRLSNFLTWRSVYSELLFLDKHWPALTEVDFEGILKAYESRERRRGA